MKKKIVPILLLLFVLLCGLFACDEYKESPMPSIQEDPTQEEYYQPETACNHVWNDGVHTAGTCSTLGYTVKTCTLCGEVSSKIYDATYGEHSFKNVSEYHQGTCLEAGYTVVKKCKLCGETVREYDTHLGEHSYDKGVYTAGTCTQCGHTDYTCTLCGNVLTENDATMGDHTFEIYSFTPGKDCRTLGTITYRCSSCGITKSVVSAEYGAHTYRQTSDTTHTCSVCGTSQSHTIGYQSTETGHSLYCTVCHYSSQEESHDFTFAEENKDATCTETGYRKQKCKCGYEKIEILSAKGHTSSEEMTEDATCVKAGRTYHLCTVCGITLDETVLPKKGHTFVSQKKDDLSNLYLSATCTAYAQYYQYCTVCNETNQIVFDDEESGLIDHQYTFTATETTHTKICSVCQAEILTESHSYTDYKNDKNYKTHRVSCSVCGKTKQEEHTYEQSACIYCSSGSLDPILSWDVSKTQDGSVMAYKIITSGKTCLLIAGTGAMQDYSLSNLPPYATYKNDFSVVMVENISSIGNYAFFEFSAVTDLSVTSPILYTIGNYAFSDMTNLTTLTIDVDKMPTLVKNNNIFRNAGKQNGMQVSLTVDFVPDYLFYPSSASEIPTIRKLTLSSLVTSVGDYAFYGQTSMTGSFCLDEITSVGNYAFYNNGSLSSLSLSRHLTSVGDYAFYGCQNASFLIRNALTDVGAYAFCDCRNLTGVLLDVETVQPHSFENTSLQTVSFTDRLTAVRSCAFRNALVKNILTENGLPSLTTIEDYAFYGCSFVSFPALSSVSVGVSALENCANLTAFSAEITALSVASFKNCSSLHEVQTDKLTTIPAEAFYGCSSLYEVTLSDEITTIGEAAFEQTSLVRITLPARLTAIGNKAFYRCVCLAEIENNGAFALEIGTNSYGNVATNARYVYTKETGASKISRQNNQYIFQDDAKTVLLAYGGTDETVTVVSDEVAPYAFYQNKTVTTVTLTEATVIGAHAFEGCDRLSSVTLAKTETIDAYSFASCYNLTTFTFPATLEKVAESIFTDTAVTTLTVKGGTVQNDILENASDETFLATVSTLNLLGTTDTTALQGLGFSGKISGKNTKYERTLQGKTSIEYILDSAIATLSQNSPKTYRLEITGSIEDYTSEEETPWHEYREKINEISLTSTDSIGTYAFYGFKLLQTVTFDGQTVGDYAFYGSGLTAIDLSSCETIGNYSFAECYALQTVTVGQNVTEIGSYAFADDLYLRTLTYGAEECTSFADTAFYGCGLITGMDVTVQSTVQTLPDYFLCPKNGKSVAPLLASVKVEEGITSIGTKALSNDSLLSLELPSTVSTVARDAFENSSLTTLTVPYIGSFLLPDSLCSLTVTGQTDISGITLKNTSLQILTLPNTLQSIGDNVFANCTYLSTVRFYNGTDYTDGFPSSLQTIGNSAFFGCSSLENICFADKDTVTNTLTLGSYAFGTCRNLTNVSLGQCTATLDPTTFIGSYPTTISGGNLTIQTQTDENGRKSTAIYNQNTLLTYIGTCSSYTAPTEMDGKAITIIGANAFSGNTAIQCVTLSQNITFLQDNAFYNCSSLQTVEGNSSLQSIGNNAFYGCVRLSSITLPDTVETIGNNAFRNCLNLSSFTVPKKVTAIGTEAFASCRNLSAFDFNDCLLSVIPTNMFSECVKLSSVTLPSSVTTVSDGAFERCTMLEYVFIPTSKNNQSIGNKVFSNCHSLLFVDFPDSVVSIGEDIFVGCASLEAVTFGKNISKIEQGIFEGCSSLTSLSLPFLHQQASVTKEETDKNGDPVTRQYTYSYPLGYLFGSSSHYGGVKTEQYVLSSYKTADNQTVENYESVLYYIPSSLSEIIVNGGNILYGAFYNCSSLQTVDISKTGTVLGARAFYGCKSLTDVLLPDNLVTIETEAFKFCTALNDFLLPHTCTSVDKTAFSNTAFSSQNKNWKYYDLSTAYSSSTTYYYPTYTELSLDFYDITYAKGYYVRDGGYSPVAHKTILSGVDYYTVSQARYEKNLTEENFSKDVYYVLQDASWEITYKKDFSSSVYPYFVNKNGTYTPTSDVTYQSGTTYYELTGGSFVRASSFDSREYYYSCTFSLADVNVKEATDGTQYYVPDYILTFDARADGETVYYRQEMKQVSLTESTYAPDTYYEWLNANVLYVSVRTADDTIEYYALDIRTEETGRIDVREGTVFLADNAFAKAKCSYLTFPSTLKTVGQNVLANSSVSHLTTPFVGSTQSSDQYLGYFFGVKNVSVPETFLSLTMTGSGSVPKELCAGCTSLQTVVLCNDYTVLSESAFKDCSALSSITLSDSLMQIGQTAFQNTALTVLEIPTGVTKLGKGMLNGCNSLYLLSTPFLGYSQKDSAYLGYIFGAASLSVQNCSAVIPNSLTYIVLTGKNDEIPLSALTGCKNVTTVVLNGNITFLANDVFEPTDLQSIIVAGVAENEWSVSLDNNEKAEDAKKHFVYFAETSLTVSVLQDIENNIVIDADGKLTKKSVEYFSSDNSVATVVDGVLVATGTGECTVRAKVTVSENNGQDIFFYISYALEVTEN